MLFFEFQNGGGGGRGFYPRTPPGSSGLRNVQSVQMHMSPPFDLSRAEKIWLWKTIANYDEKFTDLFQVSLHMYSLPQDPHVLSVITLIPLFKSILV